MKPCSCFLCCLPFPEDDQLEPQTFRRRYDLVPYLAECPELFTDV